MTFAIFRNVKAVLSSSKAADLPSTASAPQALKQWTARRDWRHAGAIALTSALAEAAVAAMNGVSALPWPGLLQIGVGYAAFTILLVLPSAGFGSGSDQ